MDCEDKIRAIIARINGDWDNPQLNEFGLLSDDTLSDILAIAQLAEPYSDCGRK